MTLRVAISGVGGDVGFGAIRGLRQGGSDGEPIWLLGLDASMDSRGRPFVDGFAQLPRVSEPTYVEALLRALEDHRVDVFLPGIDSEIRVLSRERQRLLASRAHIALAPSEVVSASDDKLLTASFLSARGIGVPETCDFDSNVTFPFPVVAKPRQGHASKGIRILYSEDELETFRAERPQEYCIQRYITGPELTIGFLYDRDGVCRDAIAMERWLENGRTVEARVADDPDILAFMDQFGSGVPGRGALNAQLRLDPQHGPLVFELNARLSGSTDMRVAVGFNDPLRLARHLARGAPIERATVRRARVRRSGTELSVEPS